MKNRNLLVLFVAVLIIVGTISAFILINNQQIQYQNVTLCNSCSMKIPISNNMTNKTIGDNLKVYNDTQHDILIVHYNSKNASLTGIITDGTQLASIRDSYKLGAEQLSISNQIVWYNKDTGYYMVFLGNDNTHDNILIVTKDKEILEHLINSIKYNENLAEDTTLSSTVSSQSSSNNNDYDDYEDDNIDYDNDYYYDDYEYYDYESRL